MYKENKFTNIIVKLIVLLLIFIFGYIFIVSLFSTVYISEAENVYYIKDRFLLNLLFILVFISLIYFLKDRISSIISGKENKMVLFNSIILSIILLIFVCITRFYPLYDQAKIFTAVKHMFVYDYSDFVPGGYIDICDVQKGITLYFFFLSKIFGKIDIAAFQVINCIFIVLSNYLIYRICKRIFSDKIAAIIHLAICLFIPQWFYSAFFYGTLPSFFFGLLAIFCFTETLFSDNIKRNYITAVLTGLFLSISIVLKTNSLIIMIAVLLLSLFFLIVSEKKRRFVITIVSVILFYLISGKIVNSTIKSITDNEIHGTPRTAHIAMALMENPDKAPGWYNGYIKEVYENNGYNTEEASKEAVESIKESINGFKSNPVNFISFLSRKIVSQWNEPTFESLYILYGRDSIGETPDFIKSLTRPTSTLNKIVRELLNVVQLLVYFSALLFFVIRYKNIKMKELIPAIIVLGGFFFHILWEAKSQYILIYFILLIPYAVSGINEIVKVIKKVLSGNSLEEFKLKKIVTKDSSIRKPFISLVSFIVIILLIAVVPSTNVIGKLLKPSWKTEEYNEVTDSKLNNYKSAGKLDEAYADSLVMPKMERKPGRYLIVKADNESFVLSPDISDKENKTVSFTELSDENKLSQTVIIFGNNSEEYSIRFNSSQKVLDVNNGEVTNNNTLQQWDYNGDKGQLYNIKEIENNRYIITCGDFFVGEDEEGNLILVDEEDKKVEVYLIKY